MQNTLAIENIEELRQQLGIDDVELRLSIRQLKVGDLVQLTFVTEKGPQPVAVRITSIRGHAFRGKLAKRSATSVAFTTAHIHSIKNRAGE